MLKGESSQPCSAKMGPRRNGSRRTETPAAAAAFSIRAAERYEYVLPNSNQNSRLDALMVPPNEPRLYRLPGLSVYGTTQGRMRPWGFNTGGDAPVWVSTSWS